MKAARLALVAMVVPFSLFGCQRPHLPESPVPAVLTDRQALLVAEQYLREVDAPPRVLTRMEPTGDGYLLHYQSLFLPQLRPPTEAHLVIVHHDGHVRELHFSEGR